MLHKCEDKREIAVYLFTTEFTERELVAQAKQNEHS